ncbi:unnamed protein product [Caenorhabditis bovis]|uniref:DUF1248 domain-containing protein n=1 Tax=Caenorhabditis bovis TaxID=2654633 RepID=A0A8S1EW99_9PELO|nr:unnamed protein product [Caenorhabditis bovis]
MFRSILNRSKQIWTPEGHKLLQNPSKEYVDKFIELHGANRPDFKSEDIEMWKTAFGKDYMLNFLCPKDSIDVIFSSHLIRYRSVKPDNPDIFMWGLAWANEKYRGRKIMQIMHNCVIKTWIREGRLNTVGCSMKTLKRFVTNILGGVFNTQHTYFISFYDAKNFKPIDGPFDGITVKNFRDVPPNDLHQYDELVFPYDRKNYMSRHFLDKNGWGKVAYDENGNVVGIAAVIAYPSGECVIQPLYADSTQIAQALFNSILKEMPLEKCWRFQVRSHDQHPGSYSWIAPFLNCPLNKTALSYATYSAFPPKYDVSKVFVNAQPTNAPI